MTLTNRLYEVREVNPRYIDPPPTWHRAERVIRQKYNLTEQHSPAQDAVTCDDTPVETKSCAAEYSDGRPGRFEIWEQQLRELVPGGKVALLVYEPGGLCSVIVTRLIDASELQFAGTVSRSRHPTMGRARRRRIPWPEVIPLDDIPFYWRGAYTEHYNAKEVESAILPIFKGSGEAKD